MRVGDKHFRTIWLKEGDERVVQLIDQRFLPHQFVIEEVKTVQEMATAIRDMHVRGAGLIGAAAAYGMYLAAIEAAAAGAFDEHLASAAAILNATRPTAINLRWAIERQLKAITPGKSADDKISIALAAAHAIADENAEHGRLIGEHGVQLIEEIVRKKGGKPANVLTHCNAGWLAFVDYGSATAPIYAAHDRGLPVHVWVDETRPRSQGSKLTAWELGQHGIPHTVIADNTGGHLMQHGEVDLVIVGTDRTTYTGDVANKIGTYLKALAAKDNNVPFYVALPSSSFDWQMRDGLKEIPIEERGSEEVKRADGWADERHVEVRVTPEQSPAANYGFDVTPRRLITGLITERGICEATEQSISKMFPDHVPGGAGVPSRGTSDEALPERDRAASGIDPEDTGVRFTCEHVMEEAAPFAGFNELNACRRKLLQLRLIGTYPNGISFGNLSIREGASDRFYITGAGTGGKPELTTADLARVTAYDFGKNWLRCEGTIIASSESLTHAAVYESDLDAAAVIHCHDIKAWGSLRGKVPTTSANADYGTAALANEVRRLFRETDVKRRRIFVMTSHEGGIITFGKNLEDAFDIVLRSRSYD